MKKASIDIADFMRAPADDRERQDWEKFLVDEGLELLANYKSIEDPKIRGALFEIIKLLRCS